MATTPYSLQRYINIPIFLNLNVLCPNKLLPYSVAKLEYVVSQQGASIFGKLTLPITSWQQWRQSTR